MQSPVPTWEPPARCDNPAADHGAVWTSVRFSELEWYTLALLAQATGRTVPGLIRAAAEVVRRAYHASQSRYGDGDPGAVLFSEIVAALRDGERWPAVEYIDPDAHPHPALLIDDAAQPGGGV